MSGQKGEETSAHQRDLSLQAHYGQARELVDTLLSANSSGRTGIVLALALGILIADDEQRGSGLTVIELVKPIVTGGYNARRLEKVASQGAA